MAFDGGDSEVTVYGSANASCPALLDPEGNPEMVVMLPPTPWGTLVTLLNLGPSLQADSITDVLGQKEWSSEEQDCEPGSDQSGLTAAVPIEGRIEVTLVNDQPRSRVDLEVAEGLDRPPLQRAELTVQGQIPCPTTVRWLIQVRIGLAPACTIQGSGSPCSLT
jgi:hypothetical protein